MAKLIRLFELSLASTLLLSASACQVFGEKYPKVTTVETVPVPVTANLEVIPVATTTLEVVNPAGSNSTTLITENQAPATTTLQAESPPMTATIEATKPDASTTVQVETPPIPTPAVTAPPQPTPTPEATAQPQPVAASQVETQPVPATQTEIDKTLTELKAEKTIEGIKVNLPDNILFEFDKYNVRAQAKPTLAKVNQLLSHYKDAQVFIFGHTDSKGDDAYNLELSQKRAAAVKYYFVNVFKVPATRMQTKGLGKTKPIAPNQNPDGSDNEAGRAKNRRVEFIIKTPTRKEVQQPGADPFRDAVNIAQNASLLAQSAKTQEDWNKIAEKWKEAIAQMKAVPESSPNYQNAQKKAVEYEKNVNYAQTQADLAVP